MITMHQLPQILSILIAVIVAISGTQAVGHDDLSCGVETANNACTASNSSSASAGATTIQFSPNASIVDFLHPRLLEEQVLADIKTKMLGGHVVVIRDAFKADFAEYIWEQLSREDANWTHTQWINPKQRTTKKVIMEPTASDDELRSKAHDMIETTRKKRVKDNGLGYWVDNLGHNTAKFRIEDDNRSKELKEAFAIFENKSTRDFLTSLSGRSCYGDAPASPSEYRVGDYSSPHTDFRALRSVDFVWNLSKDWDPSWGGAFYWGRSKTVDEGYFYPTFNTLIIINPNMISTHYVTPVNHYAKGRRLSLAWKFHSNLGDAFDIDEPIERVYGKKEDHIRLTEKEASWIARELDPETSTDDMSRRQDLTDLKQSILDNYLRLENNASFTVSWEDDEEVDEVNEKNELVNIEESAYGKEDTVITAESSILDFLDPDILEDTELISEIGTNLRQGKLVVIRDAFKADFAEYASKQLEHDDVVWDKKEGGAPHDVVPGSFSTKHVVTSASYSPKLASVLGLFEHAKTKEFLESISGRSCSGLGPNVEATWYKRGDHSNPHHSSGVSVQIDWHLSKDWDTTYGGYNYWFPGKTLDGGYNHPTFNTLMLFLPTPSNIHAVTPVAWWSKGKRLSISAFYNARTEDFESAVAKYKVEELYANEEDYIGLTDEQADWIVHSMEVDKMTSDPIRMQKLSELKDDIASKYLNPSSLGDIFVLESDKEGSL